MKTELWEQVYETMTCHVQERSRMPGIENAFAEDAFLRSKSGLCKIFIENTQKPLAFSVSFC